MTTKQLRTAAATIAAAMTFALAMAAPVATPTAVAAPQDRQSITPVGYNMVDGEQDLDNPITDPELIADVGYSSTRPSFGTEFAQEGVIGIDDRYEVTDATEAPFRWVGTLELTIPSGKRVSCTASLISPDAVITAGHCLKSEYTHLTFSPGHNGDSKPYGTANAVQVWYDQNWNSDRDIERDWGVVKLDQPIGEKTGWFGMRTVGSERLRGKTVEVIGYPTDKPSNTMWVGHGRVTWEQRGLFHHNTDTQPGNSGSPVLDTSANLIAIHFGGNDFTSVSTRMTNNMFNAVASIAFTAPDDLGVPE